jgi:hypothetical protein
MVRHHGVRVPAEPCLSRSLHAIVVVSLLLLASAFSQAASASTSASGTRAQLKAPAPGSRLASSSVTFEWTAGSDVSQIVLYVGTGGAGSYDIYAASQGTGLSAAVSGLPTTGGAIWARLWSYLDGGWQYDDYAYEASSDAPAVAELLSPGPGSTLAAPRTTFWWTAGVDVSGIVLYVGTAGAGSYDIYYGTQGGLSRTVSEIPIDGVVVYVRLWSYLGGSWQYRDYTFETSANVAQLTSPSSGSTLTSPSVTFEWTAGNGVSQIVLYVGTGGVGSYDVYCASQGTDLSRTVTWVPTTGEPVYVRLWSHRAGGWQYVDYAYKATLAELGSPAPGSTLASSSVTLGWTAGSGVSEIVLYVGTRGVGSFDVYCGSQGSSLSGTVSGLPTNGEPVYVRLWSYLLGGWQYVDYTFHASAAVAQLTSPAPGSTLMTSSSVTFEWTAGTGVSQIVLYVGTGAAGSYDVYYGSEGTSLSRTFSGLPADGTRLAVRLWSYIAGRWQYLDYTYDTITEVVVPASYDNTVVSGMPGDPIADTVSATGVLRAGWLTCSAGWGEWLWQGWAIAAKFDLPSEMAGRPIAGARLRLQVTKGVDSFSTYPPIQVGAFQTDWDPGALTWNIWRGLPLHSEQTALAAPGSSQALDIDVTVFVRNWASGAWANHGLTLQMTHRMAHPIAGCADGTVEVESVETAPAQRPRLIIDLR